MDISEIMTGQVVSICEDEPVIAAARRATAVKE